MDDKNRSKALELAIRESKRIRQGRHHAPEDGESLHEAIPVVPSGSVGPRLGAWHRWLPSGRIVEIYGPESTERRPSPCTPSPTSKAGRRGGLHRRRARARRQLRQEGRINTEELLISQPDYGEQALEIADMLVRSNAVDLVVVDSVAALVPRAEIEGDMATARRHPGSSHEPGAAKASKNGHRRGPPRPQSQCLPSSSSTRFA